MLSQLFLRDGFRCPFTDQPFAPSGRYVIARTAHILPFSFHNKVNNNKCIFVSCSTYFLLCYRLSRWVRSRSNPLMGTNLLKKWREISIIPAMHSLLKQTPTMHMIDLPGALKQYKMSMRWIKPFFHLIASSQEGSKYFSSGNISSAKSALMRFLLLSDLRKDRQLFLDAETTTTLQQQQHARRLSPNLIRNIAISNSLSLA